MKFIIKICDETGFELGRHEQYAEPYFSPVSETVSFELKPHYVIVTKEMFDKMMAERKEENGK